MSEAAPLPDGPRVQNHATPAALQTRKHGETPRSCKSRGNRSQKIELLFVFGFSLKKIKDHTCGLEVFLITGQHDF